MAIEHFDGGTVVTGTHIEFYRMCVLRGALRLELAGMRASRGVSAYKAVKQLLGVEGSKETCLAKLEQRIAEFKRDHPAEEK